jgi:S1-C subfamily serine protease
MRKFAVSIVFLAVSLLAVSSYADGVVDHLQAVSVTVKANGGQGSGVLIVRKVDNIDTNFVWTAGHVVDSLRSIREVVDAKTGQTKKIIEFKDVEIVQEVIEGGRRIGEYKMNAKVIKYSDAELGEDLALMLVRKRNLSQQGTKFYLEGEKIVGVGSELIHVGSLFGQTGSNSVLFGSLSAIGRTIDLNNGEQTIFDQVNVGAMPGSSGGGVFTKDGRYMGMLVRGGGPSFGLIVPVRRMYSWAEKENIKWALDDAAAVPTMKDILALPVE